MYRECVTTYALELEGVTYVVQGVTTKRRHRYVSVNPTVATPAHTITKGVIHVYLELCSYWKTNRLNNRDSSNCVLTPIKNNVPVRERHNIPARLASISIGGNRNNNIPLSFLTLFGRERTWSWRIGPWIVIQGPSLHASKDRRWAWENLKRYAKFRCIKVVNRCV